MREIKIVRDSTVTPWQWRVTDIDCDGEGGCALASFSGPRAEARAQRYADSLRTEVALERRAIRTATHAAQATAR